MHRGDDDEEVEHVRAFRAEGVFCRPRHCRGGLRRVLDGCVCVCVCGAKCVCVCVCVCVCGVSFTRTVVSSTMRAGKVEVMGACVCVWCVRFGE